MSHRVVIHEGREIGRAWPVRAGWEFRSSDGTVTGIAGSYEEACAELSRIERERARARKENEG